MSTAVEVLKSNVTLSSEDVWPLIQMFNKLLEQDEEADECLPVFVEGQSLTVMKREELIAALELLGIKPLDITTATNKDSKRENMVLLAAAAIRLANSKKQKAGEGKRPPQHDKTLSEKVAKKAKTDATDPQVGLKMYSLCACTMVLQDWAP